jgi:selenocysteine-specific elongation factor
MGAQTAAVDAVIVVGTAGHIDHGKSTFVRTLTGIDPDTLPEERERGITIALGFAPFSLSDGRTVAFVDVPGHERLVRTMVSGATGIDAAALCVSAVDGVMPQTREHLAILGLLGVQSGFVVLTLADQVDADYLELARADVEDLVQGTFLEGAPVIAWSAPEGRGRSEVVAALAALKPRARPCDGPFRIPVDRVFVRTGFGTVVTGTVWSGSLRDGDVATVWPGTHTARVRGIQCHGRAVSSVSAGRRAALNLAGLDRAQVERGSMVVAGPIAEASMIDVRYAHLPAAPSLEEGAAVRVLHGTAERIGRFYRLDSADPVEAGDEVWAQIRLDAPLVCWPGDRFVVRRPSPQETLGGGRIIDPWAPRHRRKDAERAAAELERLDQGEVDVWLERAGESGIPLAAWQDRGGGSNGIPLGDRVFASRVLEEVQSRFLTALDDFHGAHPLAPGAQRRQLRRGPLGRLGERAFDALLERLAVAGLVAVEGAVVRRSAFHVVLDAEAEALLSRIAATVNLAGLEGVPLKKVVETHPEADTATLVHWLEARDRVRDVAGIGFVDTAHLVGLAERVRKWFEERSELTPADFKDLTGLSRKSAIPLLEWLDREKVTRRRGDLRVAAPMQPA